MSNSDFKIGLKFIPPGKHPKEHKIVDIHRTYNSKNELVRTEYVCEHEFCGQKVKSNHCHTTIARSKHIESIVDEVIQDMMQHWPLSTTATQAAIIEPAVQVAYWDSEIYKISESKNQVMPFSIEIIDQRKTQGGLYASIVPNQGNLDEMLLTRLEISRLPDSNDDLPCLRVDFDDDNHAFSVFRRNDQFVMRLNNNLSISEYLLIENEERVFVIE